MLPDSDACLAISPLELSQWPELIAYIYREILQVQHDALAVLALQVALCDLNSGLG